MAGAGDGEWYVSSCGWATIDNEKVRLFKVTHNDEFIGIIGSPFYSDTSEILGMAYGVDWIEKPESIEEYMKKIEESE